MIALLIKSKNNIDKIILSSNKLTYLNDIINFIYKINGYNYRLNKTSRVNKNIIGNNKLAKKLLKWRMKKNIFIASKEMLINKNLLF